MLKYGMCVIIIIIILFIMSSLSKLFQSSYYLLGSSFITGLFWFDHQCSN